MTREEFNVSAGQMFSKRMDLANKKGNDYSDGDILANFKRLGEVADLLRVDVTDPFGYAMFMALMKFDRIMNLTKQDREPENESLDDSFMDFHNYLDLARSILIDEKVENGSIPASGIPFHTGEPTQSVG